MEESPKKPRANNNNNNFIVGEKIDRLEAHFKEFRKDAEIDRDLNRDVRNALIGSNLNGNKGMVHLLDAIDKRVETLESKQALSDDFMNNLKWFQRGLIGIVFAYLTWLLTK